MKLFNKTIDRQLFKQYALGSDLFKQEVVVKIFNPQGSGIWFILNSDPEDPDYLWAIVDLGYGAEVGSVSRNDLESYRGRFGLGFERDLSFDPINAEELYKGLRQGKYYADGGNMQGKDTWQNIFEDFGFKKGKSKYGLDMYYKRGYIASVDEELKNVDLMFEDDVLYRGYSVQGLLSELDFEFGKRNFADGGDLEGLSDNQQMIMNQNVELEHHHEELEDILEDKIPVPAWVVAKMATATQSVSDVTHYLDGEKELMEDENENENEGEDEEEGEDEDEIKSKEVVEPINVSAETKAELTKNFTDDALVNLKGFLKGMEGIELRDDYTFDYKNEQFEIEPIINSNQNGVSNAVFTIFDGDGEEQGEVAYSREGGKQKFTANSQFFGWDRAKFEDGGFMNGVYADGGYFDGTIPKVSTYMSNYADGGNTAINNLNKNTDTRENMISYIVNMKSTTRMSDKQYDSLEKRISEKSFAQLKKEYDTLKGNASYAKGGSLSEKEQILEALENYDSNDNEFEEDQQFFVTDDLLGFIRDLKFSDKESIVEALSDYDGDDFIVTSPLLSFVENINVNGNYAKGGEVAKAEVFGLKRNVMGTTDIEMKITGMRKAQDFIVYPIGKDDAGNVITIQSDTRIGQINLVKGVGVMSQSHSSGAYFVHLQMDKLTSFTMSESDLENLKAFINKTAGSNVGTRGVVTDNAGASRIFADGGFMNGVYAKGGVTYYNDENQYRLGRASGSFEKEIFEKVKDRIHSESFVGNFGWKTPQGKRADGYLYKLDDYDKNLIKNLKLKQGEVVFRYVNRTTAIGGSTPFIKINIEKALLYFPVFNDNDDIIFETRGVTPLWISLIEGSFADGGNVKENLYPKYLKVDKKDVSKFKEILNEIGIKSPYSEDISDKQFNIEQVAFYFKNEDDRQKAFNRYHQILADGGFMNNVYADGGQIRVGDRYKFYWTDTEGNKGYTIREVVKQNVTSGKDFRTKVMIMKVVESSMPETVGRMEEVYKPSFKKAIERGMEISMQEGKPRMADDDYATGGEIDSFIPNVGTIDTGMLKSLLIKNADVKSILSDKEFEFLKNENTDVIGVSGKLYNTIVTDGNQEVEFDLKKNVVVKHLTQARDKIKSHYSKNYAKGGGIENDGYNLKDINGKKINVGNTVRTTQPSGGLMNPANPEIGIVEKTKDAFGNDALQIKYRKQGANYDQFILLNGKINEIVDKSSSSFEQGGFMNNVYAKGGGLSEIETSKSGKLKTNGEIEESWYNTFGEGIVNKKGEEVGVKINDINKGIVYYQALAKDTPENREGYGWEEHNDEVGFIYKKFATIDDLERFVNKTEDKPKYILKADIKTVTVKRNGKDVTYKGADVLNGANLLAEGGDLTSKANYVAKRDVVSVELKDGTTIKPVNGYWIKKGAEPIGTEPTPNTSGKSEPKVGETYIRKDARGNWRAETNVENFNGYDWRISTVKTYSGNLVSSAQGGKTEATGTKGIVIFKYTMYQDPNHTLEVSKPTRLTDKVVSEQHTKGLAKFKKFMETGMFKGGGKISNFDKLSAKVAKEYEGKPVKNQYQEEYGKYYSREEAQEVGDKVAGKVKAMQTDSKAFGGLFKNVKNLAKPKPKYPNLEGKQVPLKSGDFVMVFTQDENTLSVINVGKIGSGIKPRNIDISEVDMTNFKAGGQTGTKKMNSGTETLKRANDLAKKIRMEGESWLDAKKRAFAELRNENKA